MKKIKISQEQYKNIAKLISENVNAPVVPDMGKKVNKQFNRAFGSDVKKFMKENVGGLKQETLDFIDYIYNKNEDLPSYDEICEKLVSKGILTNVDGKFKLSKSLGSAEEAKKILDDEISNMMGVGKEGIEEGDWFDSHPDHPANQSDPRYTKASVNPNQLAFEGVHLNQEFAILKDGEGDLYALYYDNIPEETLNSISDDLGYTEAEVVGRDEDGMPDVEYYYNWQNNDDEKLTILAAYADSIGDNYGEGKQHWESGEFELVKMDDELKAELNELYDKDKTITEILSGVNGMDNRAIKDKLAEPFRQQPSGYEEKSQEEKDMIKQRLAAIRAKSQELDAKRFRQIDLQNAIDSEKDEPEFTNKTIELPKSKNPNYTQTRLPFDETSLAGGAMGGPMGGTNTRTAGDYQYGAPLGYVKRKLDETTQGEGSIGQYDANALPIGRNGEFKKVGKTKAEKIPQYAGGAFVEFNDCTKLNNKTSSTGCSGGAVDGVVKLRKAKGSINAPSLAENKIYETIAKQTGKTIAEVKRIIETKKNK